MIDVRQDPFELLAKGDLDGFVGEIEREESFRLLGITEKGEQARDEKGRFAGGGGGVEFPSPSDERVVPGELPQESFNYAADEDTVDLHNAVAFHTSEHDGVEANETLRDGGELTKEASNNYETLSDAIENSEPPGNLLYRGLELEQSPSSDEREQFISKMQAAKDSGEPIEMLGFTSTSVDPNRARGFAKVVSGDPVVLEIKAKEGVFAGQSTRYLDEREVILNHGARYRVVDVQRGAKIRDQKNKQSRKATIIQLEAK